MTFSPFLLLAALPAFGGSTGLAPIALYTQFDQYAPADVVQAMQSEVTSIMAPIGLNFVWRDLATVDGATPSVALAVITFKGRCDTGGLGARNSNPGPLGLTHISDGVILPFADVNCWAVREFIQREMSTFRTADRNQVFGKALGRVLAHELYHIFANTTHHGSEGVGREFYSVSDLTTVDFQFQWRESLAMKSSKTYSALVIAAEDPDTPSADRPAAVWLEKR